MGLNPHANNSKYKRSVSPYESMIEWALSIPNNFLLRELEILGKIVPLKDLKDVKSGDRIFYQLHTKQFHEFMYDESWTIRIPFYREVNIESLKDSEFHNCEDLEYHNYIKLTPY